MKNSKKENKLENIFKKYRHFIAPIIVMKINAKEKEKINNN